MILTSPPLRENHYSFLAKYTCDGKNISPPLEISEVPEKAKSLVLIMDDPDAPEGILTHWLVWNIHPATKEFSKNSTPQGAIVGRNDFGLNEYTGPCPSSGTHVYLFKLYAIDAVLPEDPDMGKGEIRKAIRGHIISKTLLKAFYCRPFSGDI